MLPWSVFLGIIGSGMLGAFLFLQFGGVYAASEFGVEALNTLVYVQNQELLEFSVFGLLGTFRGFRSWLPD